MGAFAEVGAWAGTLRELTAGRDVSGDVTRAALDVVLAGEATDAQIAAFIVALRMKGESADEVTGLVESMLSVAAPLELPDRSATIDLVGTGGSAALGGRAFNVSTMASVVAAGAGAHGLQARQPQGVVRVRLDRSARVAGRRGRSGRSGAWLRACVRRGSGSRSPACSIRACATSLRCGWSWVSRRCSTSSVRCRTPVGCPVRCWGCRIPG